MARLRTPFRWRFAALTSSFLVLASAVVASAPGAHAAPFAGGFTPPTPAAGTCTGGQSFNSSYGNWQLDTSATASYFVCAPDGPFMPSGGATPVTSPILEISGTTSDRGVTQVFDTVPGNRYTLSVRVGCTVTSSTAAARIVVSGTATDVACDPGAGAAFNAAPSVVPFVALGSTTTVSLVRPGSSASGAALFTGAALTLTGAPPTIDSPGGQFVSAGAPFSLTVTVHSMLAITGATAGGLPPGLSLDTSSLATSGTLTISGTPTQGGLFNVRLDVANQVGHGQDFFPITVLQAPDPYPAVNATGTVGQSFTLVLPAPTGGFPPPGVAPSSLPPWLTYDSATRTLAGTPPAVGAVTVPLIIFNGNTTVSSEVDLVINPAPDPTVTVTATATVTTTVTATATATVTATDTVTATVTATETATATVTATVSRTTTAAHATQTVTATLSPAGRASTDSTEATDAVGAVGAAGEPPTDGAGSLAFTGIATGVLGGIAVLAVLLGLLFARVRPRRH